VELCRDADAVIAEYYPKIGETIIGATNKCRVIVRTGIGYETIDLESATEHGIVAVNIPAYCLDEVAEHTMAMVLSLARKLEQLHGSVQAGQWDFKVAQPLRRLRGRTLGIVGCGRIGRRVGGIARAFGLDVVVYDQYVPGDYLACLGFAKKSLESLLSQADIVTIHVPLTAETRGMIGEAQLRRMKQSALLVNASRGPVIDRIALERALENGWIAGAGLDVVEGEPLSGRAPLVLTNKTIITPHCEWYSEDSIVELLTTVADEVIRVLSGTQPLSVVNPAVLSRMSLRPPSEELQ
jgi:D-3-phosphoglycerate dehydrogenase